MHNPSQNIFCPATASREKARLISRCACCSTIAFGTARFALKKIGKRIARLLRKAVRAPLLPPFGVPFYPPSVQQAFQALDRPALAENLPDLPGAAAYDAPAPISNFPLAGMTFEITDRDILWNTATLSDPEDAASLHRWNFLRCLPHGSEIWAERQMLAWMTMYQPERDYDADETPDAWEPYTISERIANCLWFYQRAGRTIPPAIAARLEIQARFLAQHMEYYGPGTGNHPLNNARALYVLGAVLNNSGLQNVARSVLRERLEVLVTPEGFLRDGSSHYHLLVWGWVRELEQVAKGIGDTAALAVLQPACESLAQRAAFWNCPAGFMLIGDISPDFSPAQVMATLPSLEDIGGTAAYPVSGHYRASLHGMTLIAHHEKNVALAGELHQWHQHNDAMHISLADGDVLLLADPGRDNYQLEGDAPRGLDAVAHSGIFIDGFSPAPNRPWHYPAVWASPVNTARWPDADGSFVLMTDGFNRLGHGPCTRRIALQASGFVVEDTLDVRRQGSITALFHFGPDICIEPSGADWIAKSRNRQWRIVISSKENITSQLLASGSGAYSVVCSAYGHCRPAPVLALSLTGSGILQYSVQVTRS